MEDLDRRIVESDVEGATELVACVASELAKAILDQLVAADAITVKGAEAACRNVAKRMELLAIVGNWRPDAARRVAEEMVEAADTYSSR